MNATGQTKQHVGKMTVEYVAEALARVPWQRVAEAINERYFDGALKPVPHIVLNKSTKVASSIAYSHAMIRGGRRYTDSEIILYPYGIAQSGGQATAVLVHEMLHALQQQAGLKGSHGREFEDCCWYIAGRGLRVILTRKIAGRHEVWLLPARQFSFTRPKLFTRKPVPIRKEEELLRHLAACRLPSVHQNP